MRLTRKQAQNARVHTGRTDQQSQRADPDHSGVQRNEWITASKIQLMQPKTCGIRGTQNLPISINISTKRIAGNNQAKTLTFRIFKILIRVKFISNPVATEPSTILSQHPSCRYVINKFQHPVTESNKEQIWTVVENNGKGEDRTVKWKEQDAAKVWFGKIITYWAENVVWKSGKTYQGHLGQTW